MNSSYPNGASQPSASAETPVVDLDDDCPADVPGAGHDPTPNGRECRNCWAVLDV